MRSTLVVLFMIATAAGAKTRAVRHPTPPDPIATYRGNAERNGVVQGTGPRTFTRIAWTPVAMLNGVAYTTNDINQVVALDLLTGTMRWTYTASDMASEVVISDAVIYVGTFGAHQPNDDNALKDVVALEAATGHELFKTRLTGHNYTGVAVGEGKLFVMTSRGFVYALQ